jgi:cytoskeletal protein CcmA (bactofilin family)
LSRRRSRSTALSHKRDEHRGGVTIRGSVQSAEYMYVDARVEGTLASQNHRIIIGPNARIKAGVRASELEVLGTLHGNSHVRGKMILRRGSRVVGDIQSCDIIIEDGAQLKGSVDLVPQRALPLA